MIPYGYGRSARCAGDSAILPFKKNANELHFLLPCSHLCFWMLRFHQLILAMAFTLPAPAAEPAFEWLRQFGTKADDEAVVVAIGANGVYVAGNTKGTLGVQERAGAQDAFVRRYDFDGVEVWTRQFGSSLGETPLGIAIDANGVYLTGYTNGTLPGQSSAGSKDLFVRRYDFDGNEGWTRQFGSSKDEVTRGVSVDGSGVYVVGSTRGALNGQTSLGGADAFIRKYDAEGNEIWLRQFGTAHSDSAHGVSAGTNGIYVVGSTSGALSGQASIGKADAFVRKYDPNGNEVWTRQFGTDAADFAYGIAVATDGLYLAGSTDGAFAGQTSAGDSDAFVSKFDDNGNQLWTWQFGSDSADTARGVSAAAGVLYVAGRTDGVLFNETSAGGYDAFVGRYADDSTSAIARSAGRREFAPSTSRSAN